MVDDLLYAAKQGDSNPRRPSVRVDVLDGIEGLGSALDSMGKNNVETLMIAGGDGTIQAVFTDILNHQRFETMPNFTLVPCGMTNAIAKDCGLAGAPVKAFDQFLFRYGQDNEHGQGQIQSATRGLIRTSLYKQNPVYGFFIGAAGFHSAVQYSRSTVQAKGAKRSVALFATTVSFILKAGLDPDKTLETIDLEFLSGHAPHVPTHDQKALFLATTLKKLGAGLYPFWGQGEGAMQVTTVKYPTKKLLRAAPAITRGKQLPWFDENGIHSWCTDEMKTRFTGPIVFDGEIFQCDEQHISSFSVSDHVKFLY